MKNTKSLSARRIAKLMGLPESVSVVTELTEEAITEGIYEPEIIHASTSTLIAGVARKVQEASFWKAGKITRSNIYSAVVEMTKHNPMVNQKLGGPTKFATLFAEAAMKSIKEDQPKKIKSEDLKGSMFDDGGVEMDRNGNETFIRDKKAVAPVDNSKNHELYTAVRKIASQLKKDNKDAYDATFNKEDSSADLRPIMTSNNPDQKDIIGVFPDGETKKPAEAYRVDHATYKLFTDRTDSKCVASRDNSARLSKRMQENAVSSTLPPSVDSFLQDCAQFYGHINYTDICNCPASAIPELKKLARKANRAAAEDDEEALEAIALEAASLVKGNDPMEESTKKPANKKAIREGAFSEMDIDNQDGAIEGFCILMDWEITPQDITNVETLEEGLYEITVGDAWYVYDANEDCITDQGNVTSPEEAMVIEGSKARNRARRIKEARNRIAEKKALKEAANKKRYSKYTKC